MTTRIFQLHRHTDITGASGTGIVADGAQFPDGTVVIRWRPGRPRPRRRHRIRLARRTNWHPPRRTGMSYLTADCEHPAHTATFPRVVVLCGSTRFGEAFRDANLRETVAGRIVLSIGCDLRADHELWSDLDEAAIEQLKTDLDELHKRKIDLADEVLVLNVGGYIGSSTCSEVEYAQALGKPIRYLED